MRRNLASLPLLLATACASGWERSDDAMLQDCWGATRPSGGAYEVSFEALVIVDDHHGHVISARSRSCRDYRLRFAEADAAPNRQLEAVKDEDRASRTRSGTRHWTVIGGHAILEPLRRPNEFQLHVRVVALPSLRTLSQAEARRFIRDFNIG